MFPFQDEMLLWKRFDDKSLTSSFQPPEGVGWLHLSGAVVGLTAYGRGQAIAAGARPCRETEESKLFHDCKHDSWYILHKFHMYAESLVTRYF